MTATPPPHPPPPPGAAPRGAIEAALPAQSAAAQAEFLRLLANNVPVLIAYYLVEGLRCQFANRQYAQTFGHDEGSIVGATLEQVIGDEAMAEIRPHVERMQATLAPVTYERTVVGSDGASRCLEVHLLPHLGERDPAGAVSAIGAFVLITDITKHRRAERIASELENRLLKFMQASAEGIVFHRDGVILDANPPMTELTGYTLAEAVGSKTLDHIAPDHVARAAAVLASGQETGFESVIVDKHGARIPVEFIVRTMLHNGEQVRMTIVRDLRDRHAAQARIHHLAHHDALTGLPNRAAFTEQLEQHLLLGRRNGAHHAVLFIDLDHFKRVNDSLGHLVGDTLLRSVASRITASLRATDLVSRFGGDEFMVLLSGLADGGQHRFDAEEVAQKLLASVGAPIDADGRPLSVTPSIGIALYPEDGATPEELIKHADSAMYLAKARGRANYQFFDRGSLGSAYADLVLEGELAQALERGEFVLHFQPQVHAKSGALVGAEALVRWNHPERGLLLADEFIPLAETRRLMLPIGQWVMAEAVRCALHWQRAGLVVAPVAINLSSVQFESIGFVEAVAQVLPAEGVASGLLELELTERMLMDDMASVKRRLEQLKALGFSISVDDFGTGYSSLGHLKELPIDKVKIDRSFVHDLPANRDSAAITRAIIQMAASLGLRVTAEGVENEAQREHLSAQGCDAVQGLLVSRPLPQLEFEAWVRATASR